VNLESLVVVSEQQGAAAADTAGDE
jgi:hypothetical protein